MFLLLDRYDRVEGHLDCLNVLECSSLCGASHTQGFRGGEGHTKEVGAAMSKA